MNQRFVTKLAEFFLQHHLLTVEQLPERISASLQLPFLGHIVEQLVPDWMCVIDAECIDDNSSYAQLVKQYAALTHGYWTLGQVTSTFEYEQQRASVTFDSNNHHIRWEFEQYSDYVNPSFYRLLDKFAKEQLNGSFIELPTLSQETYILYLTEPLATDFNVLVQDFTPSSDELADVVQNFDTYPGITGWYLTRVMLAPHNLAHINTPTALGDYVLNIALRQAKQGNPQANELIDVLLELGADWQLADRLLLVGVRPWFR